MAFVSRFAYDLFVSYATIDDDPLIADDDASRWVRTLKGNLQTLLDQKLGRRGSAAIWMDIGRLQGNEPLTPDIHEALGSTAIMLVVLSEGYLASAWCRQEREFFLRAAKDAHAEGRIFVIHRDEIPHEHWPAEFGDISRIAWSPNDRSCVTVHPDHSAQLWDIPLARAARLVHQAPISVVTYSRDGKFVLTGSQDNTARLWSVRSGAAEGPPLRHQASVVTGTFSMDGSLVITGSLENSARLWSVSVEKNHGRPLGTSQATRLSSGIFSPAGARIAAMTRRASRRDEKATRLRLWDRETKQLVPTSPLTNVTAMAFELSIEGHRGRLSQADWLARKAELAKLGGPCDARDWNDLSTAELEQFPFVPFPFAKVMD